MQREHSEGRRRLLSVGWSVSQLTDVVLILSTSRIKPTHFFLLFVFIWNVWAVFFLLLRENVGFYQLPT